MSDNALKFCRRDWNCVHRISLQRGVNFRFFFKERFFKTWHSNKCKVNSSGMVSMLCCSFSGFHLFYLWKLRMGLFYYPPPVYILSLLPNQVCLQIFIKFHTLLAQSVNCKTTVPQAAITVISALIIVKHSYPETKVKVRTIAITSSYTNRATWDHNTISKFLNHQF